MADLPTYNIPLSYLEGVRHYWVGGSKTSQKYPGLDPMAPPPISFDEGLAQLLSVPNGETNMAGTANWGASAEARLSYGNVNKTWTLTRGVCCFPLDNTKTMLGASISIWLGHYWASPVEYAPATRLWWGTPCWGRTPYPTYSVGEFWGAPVLGVASPPLLGVRRSVGTNKQFQFDLLGAKEHCQPHYYDSQHSRHATLVFGFDNEAALTAEFVGVDVTVVSGLITITYRGGGRQVVPLLPGPAPARGGRPGPTHNTHI